MIVRRTLDDSVLECMIDPASAPPHPLLPRILEIRCSVWDLQAPLELFFGPSLRYIQLGGPPDFNNHIPKATMRTHLPEEVTTVLSQIPSMAPSLESLVLRLSDTLPVGLSRFLSRLSTLRRLELMCDVTDEEVLFAMLMGSGNLPLLERMVLSDYSCRKSITPPWSRISPGMFRGLSTLEIHEITDYNLPAFIRDLAGHATLRNLVYVDTDPDWENACFDLEELFESVGLHKEMEKLRVDDDHVKVLSYSDLHPLRHCHNLEELDIVARTGDSDLADEEIEELTSCWSRLKLLSLSGETWVDRGPTATLHAFDIITSHCPDIEVISLDITASSDHLPKGLPTHPRPRLRRINIGDHPIEPGGAKVVALYLSHLSSTSGEFVIGDTVIECEAEDDRVVVWYDVRDLASSLQKVPFADRPAVIAAFTETER